MKSLLIAALGFGVLGAAAAEEVRAPALNLISPAVDDDLSPYRWTHRPVVIFAESHADPRFGQQLDLLRARPEDLTERDVVILVDTDPAAKSELRRRLRPRGFMLVLIGKDGGVLLRRPKPLTVRELTRSIDKMPMRKREVEERRALKNGG